MCQCFMANPEFYKLQPSTSCTSLEKNIKKNTLWKDQLSEAELEQRRKEMMNNAVWRDEQRKSRVEQYKIEAAKEDEMERKKSRKADFFNPLKVSSQSTVEDRIKRNIHNIQRTKADLDKNFAKR
ncbi:putative pre-mRNA-splicing factor CWC25-like isoform X1 [Apostichopus japonicus]|uniref:Putative pre-mRNA-splicing factor CWC25-like isoform X1 n=1 Tax=Stichopus japonicus TaxID=307972 RepID=A0A2G8JUD2_STIJA|nr:putative pre-mRNA-splicing factor CWC25-like isoform X1 [Apostichopus japonicus]